MRLNQSLPQRTLPLDAIPIPACICHPAGRILKANQEFTPFKPLWVRLFKELIINSEEGELDLRHELFSGKIRYKSLQSDEILITLLPDPNFQKIQRSIVDALPNAACIVNEHLDIITNNKAFGLLLEGKSFSQFLANHTINIVGIRNNIQPDLQKLIAKKTGTFELKPKQKKAEPAMSFHLEKLKNPQIKETQFLILRNQDTNIQNQKSDIDKLTLIAESDLVATALLNNTGQLEWCNSTFQNTFGYNLSDIVKLDPLNILKGPKTDQKAILAIKKAIRSGTSSNQEICLYTRNLHATWLQVHINPVKKNRANSIGFAMVMRVINEEIETRNQLNHQLLQNEGILKAVPDLIYRVDGNGFYLSCHAFNEKDLLVPLNKIKGMRFFDMPESDELKKRVWKRIKDALRTGYVQTIEYERKNLAGETQSFESRISKSGPNEVVYFVRNITERKLAQERLEESERKWKSIIENGFDGIILLDKDGIIKDCTPNVTKHFKLSIDELRDKSILQFLSKKQREAISEVSANFLQNKKRRVRRDFKFITREGKSIVVEASIINLLQDKAVRSIVVNYRDITERTNFDAQLMAANNNLKAIINNTRDHIWLVDRNYRLVVLNKPFVKFIKSNLGETLKEGNTLFEMINDHSRQFWLEKLGETFKTGNRVRFEESTTDGQTYSTALYPIKNKSGYTTAISVFTVNITEKVNYEENLSRNKKTIDTILKTTSAGIFILDGLQMIYNNEQCTRILGRSSKELKSKTINHFVHPEDAKGVFDRASLRSKGETKSLHYTIRIIKKNGDIRWLDVSSGIIHYEGINATIATILDITDQKIHEEKLIEAKEMAEELTRLKSNFLANMSHEIRTPLNGVLGLAEIIGMTDNLNDIREMTELQKISGKRLLDTLTSILHLSRLEAENNSVHLVKIHLASLLKEIQKVNLLNFKSKGLYLDLEPVDESYYCLADETMLYQVFNNLLNNALKFTDDGGVKISYKIIEDKLKQKLIQFEVQDTGIGISSEFLPHIFESFRQESQGISRKYEGSGLGLAIAKKYLNLLNGDLQVNSIKGEGSTFYVSIPLKEGK